MQAKDIDELLKKGSYNFSRDDNYTEAQQFMDTNIDQLLERSSRTVTYGSFGKSTKRSGLGSFSKASFFASTEDGDGQDVDLDDTDLWEKAADIEAPHESIGQYGMKVLFEKIIRKQVKVYDPYGEFDEVSPEPVILLLFSGGTALNEIIRLF